VRRDVVCNVSVGWVATLWRLAGLKQFSNRFIVFLFLSDILLTELALFLAESMRETMPFGRAGLGNTYLDLSILVAVAFIWGFFLRFFGAYDPRRLSNFFDEGRRWCWPRSRHVGPGIVLLPLQHRVPLPNAVYLLRGHRPGIAAELPPDNPLRAAILVAGGYNFGGGGRGCTKVGRELAYLIGGQPWSGLSVVGFIDDDPLAQGTEIEARPVLGSPDDLARS